MFRYISFRAIWGVVTALGITYVVFPWFIEWMKKQKIDQIIRDELAEYVVTDSIRSHFAEILDRYWETPKKPHEGIGIWVSGFFGSGGVFGDGSFGVGFSLPLISSPLIFTMRVNFPTRSKKVARLW